MQVLIIIDGRPVDLAGLLWQLEERIVSALGDKLNKKLDEMGTHVDQAAARVQKTVDDLRAQLANGGGTPEEEAAAEDRLTKFEAALDAMAEATAPPDQPPAP